MVRTLNHRCIFLATSIAVFFCFSQLTLSHPADAALLQEETVPTEQPQQIFNTQNYTIGGGLLVIGLTGVAWLWYRRRTPEAAEGEEVKEESETE